MLYLLRLFNCEHIFSKQGCKISLKNPLPLNLDTLHSAHFEWHFLFRSKHCTGARYPYRLLHVAYPFSRTPVGRAREKGMQRVSSYKRGVLKTTHEVQRF